MIKNMWYAVMASKSVKRGKIVGAKRFSENLIFYRDGSGRVSCAAARCPHRGESLACGCMKDGHVQCPFHGIEFDMDGKCVLIPSNGRASAANNHRFDLKTYPVRETGGIIFVWYYGEGSLQEAVRKQFFSDGDKDRDISPNEINRLIGEPDVFDVMKDPTYVYSHVEDIWSVHYSRVIENQLDVSHLAFVHHNTIGRGNKTLSHGPRVDWLDDHTFITSANNETDTGQKPKTSDEAVIKDTNLTFKFPNIWLNHVSDKLMILAYFVPVDEEHTIIALRFYDKITRCRPVDKLIAWMGGKANKVVEKQDKRIVQTQLPKRSDLRIGERLVAADRPIVEYRKKRAELQKNDAADE